MNYDLKWLLNHLQHLRNQTNTDRFNLPTLSSEPHLETRIVDLLQPSSAEQFETIQKLVNWAYEAGLQSGKYDYLTPGT